jgi:hypothetical protein
VKKKKKDYPSLSDRTIKFLLPFAATYLCETDVSAAVVMKTKYRSRLTIEKELRVAISLVKLQFGKLCAEYRGHPSH